MDYAIGDAGQQVRFEKAPKAGVPVTDLSDYRFSAWLDTLKLRFQLGRNAKVKRIKAVVAAALGDRKIHAKAEDVGAIKAGRGDDEWDITVQDAARKRVDALVAALEREYGLIGEIGIEQIDVALDARVTGAASTPAINTQTKRLPIFEVFRERLAIPERERFAGAGWRDSMPRDVRQYWDYAGFAGPLPGGMLVTWYYGSSLESRASNGFQVRLYDKITDHNKQPLAPRDHRVRLEVQLTQEGLERAGIVDLRTLAQLETFNFQRLRKEFFNFQLMTVPANYVGKDRELMPPGWQDYRKGAWAAPRRLDPSSAPESCAYFLSEADWARKSAIDPPLPGWPTVSYEALNERVRKAFETPGGW